MNITTKFQTIQNRHIFIYIWEKSKMRRDSLFSWHISRWDSIFFHDLNALTMWLCDAHAFAVTVGWLNSVFRLSWWYYHDVCLFRITLDDHLLSESIQLFAFGSVRVRLLLRISNDSIRIWIWTEWKWSDGLEIMEIYNHVRLLPPVVTIRVDLTNEYEVFNWLRERLFTDPGMGFVLNGGISDWVIYGGCLEEQSCC